MYLDLIMNYCGFCENIYILSLSTCMYVCHNYTCRLISTTWMSCVCQCIRHTVIFHPGPWYSIIRTEAVWLLNSDTEWRSAAVAQQMRYDLHSLRCRAVLLSMTSNDFYLRAHWPDDRCSFNLHYTGSWVTHTALAGNKTYWLKAIR